MVTKCPDDLSASEKEHIIAKINPKSYQKVFFSHIAYANNVISSRTSKPLDTLNKFTLVTGIANANPLVNYLKGKQLDFKHLNFKDHHDFSAKDIENL